jgi:hypothetical protein
LHSASTESFETFEKESRRPLNPRPFEGLHNRRGASVTPTRSTNEFRHTVRKILIQGTKADEFRTFSRTFKLSTPMPTEIAVLTGNDTTSARCDQNRDTQLNMGDTDGSDSEGIFPNAEDTSYYTDMSKTSDPRTPSKTYKLETPVSRDELLDLTIPAEGQPSVVEAQSVARFWRDVEYTKKLRTLANEREFFVRKNALKHFAENFKLPTPMPSDIVALTSRGPAEQMELPRQQSSEILEVDT